jgi:hypothetical protein
MILYILFLSVRLAAVPLKAGWVSSLSFSSIDIRSPDLMDAFALSFWLLVSDGSFSWLFILSKPFFGNRICSPVSVGVNVFERLYRPRAIALGGVKNKGVEATDLGIRQSSRFMGAGFYQGGDMICIFI